MGQGCNKSSAWFKKLIPDVGIEYTGEAIPALGICTHDLLSEVEATLLQQIIDYSTGVGISIPSIDLTTCALFTQDLTCCNTCTDLPCLMQAYLTGLCTLYGDITTIQNEIGSLLNPNLNVGCLSHVTTASSLAAILQELLLEFCALYTQVQTLSSSLTSLLSTLNTSIGNFLLGAITTKQSYSSEVIKTGTGVTASIQFQGFAPIGAVIAYDGPLSVFDPTGLGYSGSSVYGWALCNGNNGTKAMGGLIPIATTDPGMGTPPVSGKLFTYASISGEYTHTLTVDEVPAETVSYSITIPPHFHNLIFNQTHPSAVGGTNNAIDYTGTPGAYTGAPAGASAPDITTYIAPSGGGTYSGSGVTSGKGNAHNNVQPYIALYYIKRVI